MEEMTTSCKYILVYATIQDVGGKPKDVHARNGGLAYVMHIYLVALASELSFRVTVAHAGSRSFLSHFSIVQCLSTTLLPFCLVQLITCRLDQRLQTSTRGLGRRSIVICGWYSQRPRVLELVCAWSRRFLAHARHILHVWSIKMFEFLRSCVIIKYSTFALTIQMTMASTDLSRETASSARRARGLQKVWWPPATRPRPPAGWSRRRTPGSEETGPDRCRTRLHIIIC